MTSTILVPLDGSPLAERALPHAAAIARATNTRITLIRAAQPHSLLNMDAPTARVTAMAEAEAYLTAIAALPIARGFTVDTAVVYGGAPAAILGEAVLRRAEAPLLAGTRPG